jgi:hypothetical protein
MSYGSISSSTAKTERPNHTNANTRFTRFRKLAVGTLLAALVLAAAAAVIPPPWGSHTSEDRLLERAEVEATTTTPQESSLSTRGQGVQAARDDLAMFMKGAMDPYDPIDNPDGYLVMLVAENKLMWKEMAWKIEAVQEANPLPQWIFNYG